MIRFYQRKRRSSSNSNTHWKDQGHTVTSADICIQILCSQGDCVVMAQGRTPGLTDVHWSSPDLSVRQAVSQRWHRTPGKRGTASRNSTGTIHTRLTVECWGESQNTARKDFSGYVRWSGQTSLKIQRKDLNQLDGAPKTAPGFLTLYSCMVLEEDLLWSQYLHLIPLNCF